MNSLVSGVGN